MRSLRICALALTLAACVSNGPKVSQISHISAIDDVRLSSALEGYSGRCGVSVGGAPHTVSLSRAAAEYRGVPAADIDRALERGRGDAATMPCALTSEAKLRAEVRRVDELQANADRSDTADRRARQERAIAQAAYDRAYAECQYQSDAALAGTRNFVDRVVEGSSLISQCMRLRGY